MRSSSLPPSGLLCAWAGAWLAGRTVPDEVLRASLAGHSRQVIATDQKDGREAGSAAAFAIEELSMTMEETHTRFATFAPTSLVEVLTHWRRGASRVRAVFPVPGDVRGLPGPAPFREAALIAGEAVFGGEIGLVPDVMTRHRLSSAEPTLRWRLFSVSTAPTDIAPLRDAAYELTEAIRETASTLAAAQVASRSAESLAALNRWRRSDPNLDLPPGFPARAISLLAQAERMHGLLGIVALDPTGAGVDMAAIRLREQALGPLTEAVRRARVAGYNVLTE